MRVGFIAGLTIFLSSAYIVVFAPSKLIQIGAPYEVVFLGACLVSAFACFAVFLFVGTPTMIAPATGVIIIVTNYTVDRGGSFTWTDGLMACFLAGLAAAFFSWVPYKNLRGIRIGEPQKPKTNLRIGLLESIPVSLKAAVPAGIGGLLVNSAWHSLEFSKPGMPFDSRLATAFGAGLLCLFVGQFWFRRKAQEFEHDSREAKGLNLIAAFLFLFSVLIPAFILNGTPSLGAEIEVGRPAMGISESIGFIGKELREFEYIRSLTNPLTWGLALTVLYILLIDFVGSPYHFYLLKGSGGNFTLEKAIKGMKVDSTIMVFAPAAGIVSPVYYGENEAGRLVGAKSGAAAAVCGSGFLVLLFFGFSGSGDEWQIQYSFPQSTTAAIIAFLGGFIAWQSLKLNSNVADPDELINENLANVPPYLVAIGTGLFGNISVAFLIGLLVYLAMRIFMVPNTDRHLTSDHWPLVMLTGLAIVSVALQIRI